MPLHVGTSGWQYRDWRGAFYPPGVAQHRWLGYYAERFATVEVNNTFYMLPAETAFDRWRAQTPDGFLLALKMNRYLTHVRRLRDPEDPVRRFCERADRLGARLGPILLQLGPQHRADVERLDTVLSLLAPRRVAFEPRHRSWYSDDVRAVLGRHDVPLCLADRLGRPMGPLWRTASWGYVRLHEGTATPRPCYGPTALRSWGRRIAGLFGDDADVFVYFNNDPGGAAVRNARTFLTMARHQGRAIAKV